MVSESENEEGAGSQSKGKWWDFPMKGTCTSTQKGNTRHGSGESEESGMTENRGGEAWFSASSLRRVQLIGPRAWILCYRRGGPLEGISIAYTLGR